MLFLIGRFTLGLRRLLVLLISSRDIQQSNHLSAIRHALLVSPMLLRGHYFIVVWVVNFVLLVFGLTAFTSLLFFQQLLLVSTLRFLRTAKPANDLHFPHATCSKIDSLMKTTVEARSTFSTQKYFPATRASMSAGRWLALPKQIISS